MLAHVTSAPKGHFLALPQSLVEKYAASTKLPPPQAKTFEAINQDSIDTQSTKAIAAGLGESYTQLMAAQIEFDENKKALDDERIKRFKENGANPGGWGKPPPHTEGPSHNSFPEKKSYRSFTLPRSSSTLPCSASRPSLAKQRSLQDRRQAPHKYGQFSPLLQRQKMNVKAATFDTAADRHPEHQQGEMECPTNLGVPPEQSPPPHPAVKSANIPRGSERNPMPLSQKSLPPNPDDLPRPVVNRVELEMMHTNTCDSYSTHSSPYMPSFQDARSVYDQRPSGPQLESQLDSSPLSTMSCVAQYGVERYPLTPVLEKDHDYENDAVLMEEYIKAYGEESYAAGRDQYMKSAKPTAARDATDRDYENASPPQHPALKASEASPTKREYVNFKFGNEDLITDDAPASSTGHYSVMMSPARSPPQHPVLKASEASPTKRGYVNFKFGNDDRITDDAPASSTGPYSVRNDMNYDAAATTVVKSSQVPPQDIKWVDKETVKLKQHKEQITLPFAKPDISTGQAYRVIQSHEVQPQEQKVGTNLKDRPILFKGPQLSKLPGKSPSTVPTRDAWWTCANCTNIEFDMIEYKCSVCDAVREPRKVIGKSAFDSFDKTSQSAQHSEIELDHVSELLDLANCELAEMKHSNRELLKQLESANCEHAKKTDTNKEFSKQLKTANQEVVEMKAFIQNISEQFASASQELMEVKDSNQHLAHANVEQTKAIQLLSQQLETANAELAKFHTAEKELSSYDIEPWKVARTKVQIGEEIASGGWGKVSKGNVRVAVKQLHTAILSQRNIQRLRREISILSEIRHPNLVQFIGAVFDEKAERLQASPLIITELLDTDLRSAYERNRLSGGQKLSILIDVAKALKYLHERHDPIIHRDVSAPNVLLEALPGGNWKGKLTDLGSANFAQVAHTLAEGAIIYAAPETIPNASDPDAPRPPQTFKIDVFSYGVMLCEVTTSRMPDQNEYGGMRRQVQRTCFPMFDLICQCTKSKQEDRPIMAVVLTMLDNIPSLP